MENHIADNNEQIKQIDEVNQLIWNLRGVPNFSDDPIKMVTGALEKAKNISYTFGVAQSLLNLGMGSFIIKHDLATATLLLDEALQLFREMGDKKWKANTHLTISIINNSAGNPELALYNGLKGLDHYEAEEDADSDKMMAYYIVGTVYKDLRKYEEAEKYYITGSLLKNAEKSTWTGRLFAGLANVYTEQKKYDDAITISLKSLELFRAEGNATGESRALNDIGLIYKSKKEYEKALEFFNKGLEIRMAQKISHFAVISLMEIAAVHIETGKDESALQALIKAEAIAAAVNLSPKLTKIYKDIGNIYKRQSDYKNAFLYYEKLLELTANNVSADTEAKIVKLQTALLKEKEEEIERLRNVELKDAYAVISERNKEVTDSINYAKRIQQCMLPSAIELKETIGTHFLFYKPKDIVSGDFYWATQHRDKCYIAVCDSTGHGVPGAFMSLLNIGFLNEAIKEKHIEKPNEVFNYVRERLINSISGDGQKDGMDGILVCIDMQTKKLTYAASNNEPILISDKIIELPKDKMPVGTGERNDSFVLHTIGYKPGDMLYLYTDGYADQFGGERGKKFKYKQLNNLLLDLAHLEMTKQELILDETFENWKGSLGQVDDVLIVGVRL